MTPDRAISVEGLSHRYGEVEALRDATLHIAPGELVGLIGPDGVGKSTLMALAAGARRIQDGRVTALGGDMADPDHRRRVCGRIAYMPQGLGRNLYPTLTVRENIDVFARMFEGGPADPRRVAVLLDATGLAPFPDRPAGKLSGGMKQKLGLCCALVHEPDVILLDEPTTGVDPLSRRQFWALIAAIRAARPSIALMISTAYLDEAEGFDRLAAMDAGRIVAVGTPAELRGRTGAATLDQAYRRLRPGAPAPPPPDIPPRAASDGESVISAVGLTRRFGDFTAVDRVDFEIARGEIFGFLGSNGCGKTTTMKMLVGLLPPDAGSATLFGRPADAQDIEARRAVGYMTQGFSLFGELTVRGNLMLHGRMFDLAGDALAARVEALADMLGLRPYLRARADSLPLGVRQRLSLAAAIIHEPPLLILDEPTSGVDPDARDAFWRVLASLSRDKGVTIFVSTHFMPEAARCDRIALMHAGRVLRTGPPAEIVARAGAATLEDAFVAALREAGADGARDDAAPLALEGPPPRPRPSRFSLARAGAFAWRETLEALRDPVRMIFALAGSALMMVLFCYGVSLDVEAQRLAVLDLDQSPESRAYVAAFEGSRYFDPVSPAPDTPAAARALLARGEAAVVLELPPDFGRRVAQGEPTEVLALVDGAMPFKGETVEGYVEGVQHGFLADLRRGEGAAPAARIEGRFRYNQGFESIAAMAPAMPAILLFMLPAVLGAISVARERELGSIVNLYVTPTTRLEFMLGKQAPYVAVGFVNFLALAAMTIWLFGVPLKGAAAPLIVGAALYGWAATAFGLMVGALTSSQVAAVFAAAILALIPTIQFSGLLQPVSTLDGAAQALGRVWPASHFLHLSVGAFAKGLGWTGAARDLLALCVFGPAFTVLAALALRGQER